MEFVKFVNGLSDCTIGSIREAVDQQFDDMYIKTVGDFHMVTVSGDIDVEKDTIKAASKGLIFKIIFDGDGRTYGIKVVAMSLPIGYDYAKNGMSMTDAIAVDDGHTYRHYDIVDGTNVRMYHVDGEWRFSTYGSMDAGKYGRVISDHLGLWALDKLDTGICYQFVVCTPDNRIVVGYGSVVASPVTLVAMFDMEKLEEIPTGLYGGIETDRVELDDLTPGVLSAEVKYPGYIVIRDDGKRMRFESELYQRMAKMRNNTPLEWRCVQVMKAADELVDEFTELFPCVYADVAVRVHRLIEFIYEWRNVTVTPGELKTGRLDYCQFSPRLRSLLKEFIQAVDWRSLSGDVMSFDEGMTKVSDFVMGQDVKRIMFLIRWN